MAERRMFSKTVVQSARFLKMPLSTQALYFQMGISADDDGIVEAFSVMRMAGAAEDDLRILVARGFVKILNEDLVSLILDWKENNYIRSDRYKKSAYHDLLVQVSSDENGMTTNCLPDDNQTATQDRIGKDRIDKDRIDKVSLDNNYSLVDRKGDCKGENDLTQDKPAPGTSAGIPPENGKGYRFSKDKSGEANSIPQDKSTGAKSDQAYPYAEIVEYLNRTAGTAYRPNSKDTKKHIRARFQEGFTLADFKTVIDKKAKEWGKIPAPGQQDMRLYLRPSTLFGTKFESYLNQPDTSERSDFSDYRNFKPSTQGGTGNEAYKHFKPSR